MTKTRFLKVLFKQQFEGSKYKLNTIFYIMTLCIILIEEIIVFQIQTSNSNQILKNALFPIIPIFAVLLSCAHFILLVLGFILDRMEEKGKNEKFLKNSANRISLIIRHLIQIIYIPSIISTINLLKSQFNQSPQIKIVSALLFTLIILLSQLIITWLQSIHFFSVKAQSFGKNSLRNPFLIISIHNLLFPFAYEDKWFLITIDVIAFVLIGVQIFRNPRLCEQYDKYYRACVSGYLAVQVFMAAQYLQQNSKQNGIIIFLSIILSIGIFLLIQKRYESCIKNCQKLDNEFYLMREIYYNLISNDYQNIALILLYHQRNCTDTVNCHCRKVLFNSQPLSQTSERDLRHKKGHLNQNALKMVIEFYRNLFAEKNSLEKSKIKIQFENKSAQLLFYTFILVREQQKYTKAFLLLKEYQKRWKNCSFLFEIQTEILIEQITELKNIHQGAINKKNPLYNDYWAFYQKYQTFFQYFKLVTSLAQSIWLEMLNQQPDEQKVYSDMKRFHLLDKKISLSYQSLIKAEPEHINHVNLLMKKYQNVVLNIFNQKLSVVKNANIFLQKKSSQLKGDDQILDKEGRIFAKSLNNIVFLVNAEKICQENSTENIQNKNRLFRQNFEKNTQIDSLNGLILPEIRENHNRLVSQFLLSQNPSLDHPNTVVLIGVNENVKEIEAYEIWCQTVIVNQQILISVILNNDKIGKRYGIFVQNEKEEIIYHSANLSNFVSAKSNFSVFRSPEDGNFISKNSTQSSFMRDTSLSTQEIIQFKDVNMKVYQVKLEGFEEADMIEHDEMAVYDIKNSQLTLSSYQRQKTSVVDEILQKIQHTQKNEKIIKLQKFYQDIHGSQKQNIACKVAVFFILITMVFVTLLTVCYLSNIQKSSTISYLSGRVNAFSKLINSICETNTAVKLLIIKSYFEDGFTEYQKGIDIINFYRKQILDSMQQIANDSSVLSIYHLKQDASSFFSEQNIIPAIMNGFMKQVTFLTDQSFQAFNFSPILSQNSPPLTRVVSNFFEANYNVVNSIFLKLFFTRGNFFKNNIIENIYNFNQNFIVIFSAAGLIFMALLSGLVIYFRKKNQLVVNEGLEIFEKVSLQHKSLRLKKIRESKQIYFATEKPKKQSKSAASFIKTLGQMKSYHDCQNLESNSFNFFEGILTQQKTLSKQNAQQKFTQQSQVPFFSRIAQIGRKKVFKGQKYQISALVKILYFLPFFIYFSHLLLQNFLFNSEIEQALNFQSNLALQGQFIAGSRQYSIQLGMFELPFDLGTSNVKTIEDIYQLMHQIKKQQQVMDADLEFSKMRYLLDSTNVCQNINLLSQSQTLGVEITRQKCMEKRLGLSLGKGKGFHQALVYYLETIRDFSRLNQDPFNFTIERRYNILQSQTLRTIVHLGEYLHQLNDIEYSSYRQDINNKIKRFNKINEIVMGLIIALWMILTFFAWNFIINKKREQINLIKAVFKLISFSVLAKSDDLAKKVAKNNIHSYIK